MLGLSASLNYYLFQRYVDLRKGIFRLCEEYKERVSLDPTMHQCIYVHVQGTEKLVKILHYENADLIYALRETLSCHGEIQETCV